MHNSFARNLYHACILAEHHGINVVRVEGGIKRLGDVESVDDIERFFRAIRRVIARADRRLTLLLPGWEESAPRARAVIAKIADRAIRRLGNINYESLPADRMDLYRTHLANLTMIRAIAASPSWPPPEELID